MIEVTIRDLTPEDAAALMESCKTKTSSRRRSEWKLPVGDCLITFTVEGPTTKSDAELCQYAIDVLEVAKKHSTLPTPKEPL